MRALYRVYDEEGRLLYVGQSSNPLKRLGAHIERQEWRYLIAYTAVTWHTDAEIDEAERRAIFTERPQFNLEHTSPLPVPQRRRVDEAEADNAATRTAVMAYIAARGGEWFTLPDVMAATGLSKYAVVMILGPRVRAGQIARDDDGEYRSLAAIITPDVEALVGILGCLSRRQVSEILGWSQSRTIKAIRAAIAAGCVHTTGTPADGSARYVRATPDTPDTFGRTPYPFSGRTRDVVRPSSPTSDQPTERTL